MDEFLNEIPVIKISETNFKYIGEVKNALEKEKKFLLLCEEEKQTGILGFMNCIKQEPGGVHARYGRQLQLLGSNNENFHSSLVCKNIPLLNDLSVVLLIVIALLCILLNFLKLSFYFMSI